MVLEGMRGVFNVKRLIIGYSLNGICAEERSGSRYSGFVYNRE